MGNDYPGRFGRYEVTGRVGAGGMGVVLSALDPKLKRQVAIKVMPRALRRDASAAERFRREAFALAKLSHPSIVRVFDAGEQEGHLYYVMELLEGRSLDFRTLPDDEPAPRDWRPATALELLEVFTPVADALEMVHRAGLVHRDIKPANIHSGVPDRGSVLTDFGLAWLEGGTGLTKTGMVVGTGRYMAPEQLHGAAPDPVCDLYGLGATMYELATGRPPFHGHRGEALLALRMTASLPPLGEKRPDLPAPIAAIVDTCVKFEPTERYGSARDLHRALVRARRELDPSSAALEAAAVALPAGGGRSAVASSLDRRALLNLLLILAVVAATGIVSAIAVARLLSGADPGEPGPRPAVAVSMASAQPAAVRPSQESTAPPEPLRPLLIGETGEAGPWVALAEAGGNLLAAWFRADGRLGARISRDRGASWVRPRIDGALAAARDSRLRLVSVGDRFYLAFAAPDESGSSEVAVCSADSEGEGLSLPIRVERCRNLLAPIALAGRIARDGPSVLLAAWLSDGEISRLRLSWSRDGGLTWSLPETPSGPAGADARAVDVAFAGEEALAVWQLQSGKDRANDLVLARSQGPEAPWSAPRIVFEESPAEEPPDGRRGGSTFESLASLARSASGERGLPVLTADGRTVYLQWSEQFLIGGRALMIARSDDGGRSFLPVAQADEPPANVRFSALIGRSGTVWSCWVDKSREGLFWTGSSDGGSTWRPREALDVALHEHRCPAMAIGPGGVPWTLWSNLAGEVRVVRLP